MCPVSSGLSTLPLNSPGDLVHIWRKHHSWELLALFCCILGQHACSNPCRASLRSTGKGGGEPSCGQKSHGGRVAAPQAGACKSVGLRVPVERTLRHGYWVAVMVQLLLPLPCCGALGILGRWNQNEGNLMLGIMNEGLGSASQFQNKLDIGHALMCMQGTYHCLLDLGSTAWPPATVWPPPCLSALPSRVPAVAGTASIDTEDWSPLPMPHAGSWQKGLQGWRLQQIPGGLDDPVSRWMRVHYFSWATLPCSPSISQGQGVLREEPVVLHHLTEATQRVSASLIAVVPRRWEIWCGRISLYQ